MSTLIPKHQNISPIWGRYQTKQYVSPTTGIQIVDEAVAKTKQQQSLRNRQKHKGTSSKIGAASPTAQKEEVMRRQRILAEAGYYKGKIDGKWGKKSKAAQATYDRDNGKTGETMFQTAERGLQNARNLGLVPESSTNKENKSFLNTFIQSLSNSEPGYVPEESAKAMSRFIGIQFPAVRQVVKFKTRSDSGTTETNKDFSNSYLENLSQLGQVAYRQYVREHGYPKPGQQFNLSLEPSVYKEINPSGRYADFTDLLGIANAALGGDRQVEYTDGGMSGTAYVDNNGNIHWNTTDASSWTFDPGQKERLQNAINENPFRLGSRVRYQMGILDENNNNDNYEPIKQNLTVTFPADTISGIARYSTVPKIKQR